MVKAYLRFESDRAVGVVTSRECNVAWDKTGRLALTGCIEAVGIWNLRQGVQDRALAKGSERVTQICVREAGGDGKSVCAVGYVDGSVRLWDFQEGTLLQTLQGHRSAVSCFCFDLAGHLLASGSNDTDIVLWDLVAESGVARLRGHVDQVTAVAFWEGSQAATSGSSPARLISSSKDRLIRIWSLEMQICVQAIAEHRVEVWSLALNGSQTRLVAGSGDKFLRVWALAEPEEAKTDASEQGERPPLATFIGAVPRTEGQGNALGLRFARPKGVAFEVLLCQGSGKTLEVLRCFDDAEVRHRQKRRKRRVAAKQRKKAGQTADGEDADADGTAPPEGEAADDGSHAADEFTNLHTHRCSAKVMSMSWCEANSSVLLGLTNNVLESVRLASVKDDEAEEAQGRTIQVEQSVGLELAGHRTGVRALSVAHDDSVFMSAASESVKIWSASTGRCVRTMPSGYGLCGFFVAGNEHVLLGTKEGNLELFNIQLGEQTQTLAAHSGAIYGLAERPDHKGFVSCSADRTLRFFQFTFAKGADAAVTFAEEAERATELPDELLAVAYSPNGKWIAAALLNHTVQVLFADTLKFYLSLYGHRLPVMSLAVSDDSQIIASGSADKNVRLWSTQFGNCLKSLRAHDESVMQVRFMPGTHYLATAGRDQKLKLWDCDSYELISSLSGHACEILAMALSQDAAFVVTAGSDKQIRIWRRSQEQLFLSEERAKELEEQFEQEVEREDVQAGPGVGGGEAVVLRPSRRTVESVRTTERLMEVLDEAKAQQEQLDSQEAESGIDFEALKAYGQGSRHPCARAIAYINTLTASNIYEVLLALPFSHALILLQVISRFFDAVASLPGGEGAAARAKVLSAAASLETPCQAALITAYVHHSEFAATVSTRPLLLQLRSQMRSLLQAEKDRVGLSMAGFAHLQRLMKRTSVSSLSAAGAGTPKADADRVPSANGRGRGRGGRSGSGGRGRKKQRR